jgi:hypothetical protein
MKKGIYISLITLCFFSCYSQPGLTLVPLNELTEIHTLEDRGSRIVTRTDYVLVKGFQGHKRSDKLVDSLSEALLPKNIRDYSHYNIFLYKHSKNSNIENVKKYGKNFDRNDPLKDLIYIYSWSNGKFMGRVKFKNGKMIEPSTENIIIKPLPDSTIH